MKIELYNFGIIKHFSYDTKNDFTIIFGKNNTGKSYAISAVYLIIKNILSISSMFLDFSIFNYNQKRVEVLLKQLKNRDNVSIKKDIEEIFKDFLFNVLIKNINNSFKNTFDSINNLNNKLTNQDLKIIIETNLITINIKAKEDYLYISELKIKKDEIKLKKSTRNLKNRDKNNIITIYNPGYQEIFSGNILTLIGNLFLNIYLNLKKDIKKIYYLPASRSGLYLSLSAFGQIIAELSQNRNLINHKIELPSIPEPLSDYFLELSTIKVNEGATENKITEIANKIEKNILNGKIEFDENRKKIMFNPKNTKLKLDLSYTSSMVSEISPIVSYLRYILNYHDKGYQIFEEVDFKNSKSLIVIEEPEAHLHPDIQIELLTQFAELTQTDVKFILTTHSNYMFNKFNNLILAKRLNLNTSYSLLFKETENGSEAIETDLDEFGTSDENFIYTSEKLYNEKMELIKKFNEED